MKGITVRTIARGLARWRDRVRALAIVLVACLLTGCVDYDIGIDFRSQTEGAIVQHVRIAERLSAFDRQTVKAWTASLDRRARELGGRVRQRRDGDLDVTIPFINGDDLAEKFDRFFGMTETELFVTPEVSDGELPKIASTLTIEQQNYLVAIHNDLTIDLDLRGLSLLADLGRTPFQADSDRSFVDLRFRLTTPWGSTIPSTSLLPERPDSADSADSLADGLTSDDRETVWALAPGTMQHLEASFWIPSPIGIGAIAVVLLVAAGSFLKHRVFAKIWPKTHGDRAIG